MPALAEDWPGADFAECRAAVVADREASGIRVRDGNPARPAAVIKKDSIVFLERTAGHDSVLVEGTGLSQLKNRLLIDANNLARIVGIQVDEGSQTQIWLRPGRVINSDEAVTDQRCGHLGVSHHPPTCP